MTPQLDRRQTLIGYGAALISAVGYGAGAIAAKKVVTDVASPMTATAFSLMFGTLIMAVFLPRSIYGNLRSAPKSSFAYMALAGLAGVWGVAFFHFALQEAPVALVMPVSGTFPLWAILMTHLFLQRLERVTLRTVLGAGLVVVGVGLIAVGQSG